MQASLHYPWLMVANDAAMKGKSSQALFVLLIGIRFLCVLLKCTLLVITKRLPNFLIECFVAGMLKLAN